MELWNAKEDENEKTLEASVVDNDKDAGKDGEVVVEAQAEKDENEVLETSAGDGKFVETFMDAKPEEAALTVMVEENKTANGTVEEPSLLTSVEVSSSGMKKPQGLVAKKKVVKKVKKLVKNKILKGSAVEENVTVGQGIAVVKMKKDKESAEPSLGESEKEINKVTESVAASPKRSSGKETDSNDMELEELHGPKEGVDLDSIVLDKRDAGASSGGNVLEAEKAIEGSVESPENALSVKKKQPRKLRAKAKLRKTPAAQLVKTQVDKGIPQLDENEQRNDVEKLNALEVNTSEGGQQKTQEQLNENKRRRKKRQGKQVLGSNKKQRNEVVAAADVTQQRMEEKKEQPNLEKREMDGEGKEKIGGLIFMCNAKTRPDCFRFRVMGVQEKRKDYVMSIKPGLKLFLYDYDLKLLYGIFQASSAGGMKLERSAFGGSFPAQVRFKVVSDCIPLPESQFKQAIKENYNNRNKFKTELTPKQVFKLKKLFRPAALPAQLTHTLPIPIPRDADRRRSDNDHYAPGGSRTQPTRTHERNRIVAHVSPPPRREEPPRDLYLSEREYRTYGLRRETSQHYPVPPPDSSYHSVNRDRVPLDSYHPSSSVDYDRLLRRSEMEMEMEARLLHLPERDYYVYDHLSSRREILGRNSPDPPASAVALDSYRRDPHYRYEYRSPERLPRPYMASSGREDDDLYSRYVTADSLAEYYRSSSRRYPSIAESERLSPSIASSRYGYSGSLPYSHR